MPCKISQTKHYNNSANIRLTEFSAFHIVNSISNCYIHYMKAKTMQAIKRKGKVNSAPDLAKFSLYLTIWAVNPSWESKLSLQCEY